MTAHDKYTIKLPKVSAAGMVKGTAVDLDTVHAFFVKLNHALKAQDLDALGALFRKDAWLRDLLALSWDFRTIEGLDKILFYFRNNLLSAGLHNLWPRKSGAYTPTKEQKAPGVEWVETIVDFETNIGKGSGIIRIVSDDDGENRIFVFSLALQELKGHEENVKLRRPHGGNNSLVGGSMLGNWKERRDRDKEFLEHEPSVLVIGAGQYHHLRNSR